MIYRFNGFELDEDLYELRRGNRLVALQPKVFDVLAHLLRERQRVVSKDELLETFWPQESVSDSVLPRCIAAARKALGESSKRPRIIQTLHGRGYRFTAEVEARESAREAAVPPPRSGTATSELPSGGAAPGDAVVGERAAEIFIGREEQLRVLSAALTDTLGGRGHVVLLAGEAGIGKTRTALELASETRRRGAEVLTGRCIEGEGAPAFWPWMQILRTAVRDRDVATLRRDIGRGAADLVHLVPELARRIASRPSRPGAPSEQARFRLFDSVTTFLAAASRTRGIVIIVDDLHWADAPSLLLFQFIARELRDARLLLVGTYRDIEVRRPQPLAQMLGEVARQPHCERLQLEGFTESDVTRFIALTSSRAPAGDLAAAVHRMTEGNPFFVREIVGWLALTGRLERDEKPSSWGTVLPQGVREAIGRRLSTLSGETNRLLGVASVIGREFEVELLARVAGVTGEPLLQGLDEAVASRIVVPIPGPGRRFGFTHALIRETLYEELATAKRVDVHRTVAGVLEELPYDDPAAHVAELAHHFYQALSTSDPTRECDVDKAVECSTRAAEAAVRIFAYEDAAAHYERALEAQRLKVEPGQSQRCELLLALGESRSRAGERQEARQAFQRAADLARRLGDEERLARAALGFGGRGEVGGARDEPLLVLLEEALAVSGVPDPLRSRLLSRLAGTAPHSDSMETRARLSRDALELARRGGDAATLAAALAARHWALLGPDHVVERLAIGQDLLRLARRERANGWAFVASQFRFEALLSLGDVRRADRELTAMERLAEELRQPVERWFVARFRASRALAEGRFEHAERLMKEGLRLGTRAQHPAAAAVFRGQLLWLSRDRGRVERLTSAPTPASDDVESSPYPGWDALVRAGAARFNIERGRVAEARRDLEELAVRDFGDIPRNEHWLACLALLAETCAELAEERWAEALSDLLRPFAERNVVDGLDHVALGSVSYFLALLAAARDRSDEAADHFERALAMNARMGARPALARTQHAFARLLARRGSSGDRQRARALVSECLRTTEELPMDPLHTAAQQMIRSW